MDKKDFLLALNDLRECWPRMNLSDRALDIWYEKLGVQYRCGELKSVISEYIEAEEKQPTIAILLSKLRQRFPERTRESERAFILPPAFPALEWVMDILGPAFVEAQIKSLVAGRTWTALIARRDWVAAYRERMDELFVQAKKVSGISDGDFDRLMHQHRYGRHPQMRWRDEVAKTEMFGRWKTTNTEE